MSDQFERVFDKLFPILYVFGLLLAIAGVAAVAHFVLKFW